VEAAVSLNRLDKQYGEKMAVDGLSFDVPAGSIFGLLGRNGAGKTTTIRMIMDIIRPDSGQVFVLGQEMQNSTKDRIGYLPEERGLYPKMQVIEMLEFQGTIKGLSAAEARARASRWLDRLELGKEKQNKVEELSKGMQQKVQFIAAVMGKPELLILDEPFSGMDPKNQELFKDMILALNRGGATIIFSTHVMESAERMCQEIALIDHGKAVLNGTIPAIKERFGKNSVVLEFTGDGSHLKDLPFVEEIDDYGQFLELRLAEGADPQAVLQASVGRISIRRFEITTPTLHNIFLQQVG
jgi:ABC-2 type transport system ATP-binding protein